MQESPEKDVPQEQENLINESVDYSQKVDKKKHKSILHLLEGYDKKSNTIVFKEKKKDNTDLFNVLIFLLDSTSLVLTTIYAVDLLHQLDITHCKNSQRSEYYVQDSMLTVFIILFVIALTVKLGLLSYK